jgi:hypothetical protein
MSEENRSAQSPELSEEELKEASGGAVGAEGTPNQIPGATAAEVAKRLQGRL